MRSEFVLTILFVAFCVLNLLSTLLIFSACAISGRESRRADAEQAAVLQHIRIQSALERISTVNASHTLAA